MGNKKKSCKVSLYMSLFVVLLVCYMYLFVGCCSYAMTIAEVENGLNYVKDNISSSDSSYSDVQNYFSSTRNEKFLTYLNNLDISSYNMFTIQCVNGSRLIYNFYNIDFSQYYLKIYVNPYSNTKYIAIYSSFNNQVSNVNIYQINHYNYGSNLTSFNTTTQSEYIVNYYSGFIFVDPEHSVLDTNNNILSNNDLQSLIGVQYLTTTYNPSNIILNSTSNHKFGFNDKNQCRAYLTGFDIEDITFYVDRYINDEWQQFTDASEYYRLVDFDDPYYIFWSNINYFPVGTYRYRAVYDNDNQYISDTFSITNMIIDNEGTYDNGNINIDTGNTVDNIKDYFGGQADTSIDNITDDDIENSLGLERTVNPYQNFVLTIVNGLLDSLLGTSPDYISFRVHSWGQTFKIYVDDIVPNYGTDLRNFLTLISTVVVMIYIIRWITKVVESVNTANVDTTLDLIEEKYSDLL